jgi:hypothetical protein
MFFLGHMGIGRKLVSPFSKGLSQRMIIIGAILPDLIDKPLYYGLSFLTGRKGDELGLISGTRTFGHTALFLLILTSISFIKHSRVLAAISMGIATHLLLDGFGDHLGAHSNSIQTTASALLWPLSGWKFPAIPYEDIATHLSSVIQPYVFWGEVIGGSLLLWEARKIHESTMPEDRGPC